MIYIKREVYNELIKLKNENCGFAYGKRNKIENIFKIKNISNNPNEFKMKKIDVFIFIFKIFINFLFKGFNFVIYHTHSLNKNLSKKDIKNMILKITYIIIYKNKLFLYKKINNEIIELKYIIYKEDL